MKTRKLVYLIICILCFSSYRAAGQIAMLQDKIVAPDTDRSVNDRFSSGGEDANGRAGSVSIHGNFAVVGAVREDGYGLYSGAAYLYEYIPEDCDWVFRDKIVAQALDGTIVATAGEEFGASVAIHGNIIAIGAKSNYNNGADGVGPVVESGLVYIYEIVASSANIIQHVHAFNNTGGEDQAADDEFGVSVHLSSTHLIVGDHTDKTDENGVDMGMLHKGAAFIYEWDGTEYDFQNKVVSDAPEWMDFFGCTVSISSNYASVGASTGGPYSNGKVEIFEFDAGVWSHHTTFNGDILDPFGDNWDHFGWTLEMNQTHLVVGVPYDEHDASGGGTPMINAGSAYIFKLDWGLGTWSLVDKVTASDRSNGRLFGSDVSISGNKIVIGSKWNAGGKAYLFEEDGFGNWNEIQIISGADISGGDNFGHGVDLFGDGLIVGAPVEDENDVPDVDGLYPFGTISNAGSAFLFELNEPADMPTLETNLGLCTEAETVTLTIVAGDLNDADEWAWYEGDCDSDPIAIGPTSIEVDYEDGVTYCARGVGECDWFEPGECGCITLEFEDSYWHQSTDLGMSDHANDVITDHAGNVYVAGEYFMQTTFDGGSFAAESITSGSSNVKSYVAKYDNCGNLLWVAWSDDIADIYTDSDRGISITLDETNGRVYVAGNFQDEIHFNGGIGVDAGPPSSATIVGLGEQGYVACFNMNDGVINYIEAVSLNTVTRLSAITVNENNGKIYVGGINSDPTLMFRIFTQRYTPTALTIGPADWVISGASIDGANYLGDLDYDEDIGDNGSLWMIGGFRGQLLLLPGSGVVTATNQDAFIARFVDGVTPTQTFLRQGFVNGQMFGEGIAVDEETGNAYFTGHYRSPSPLTNIFGMIGQFLPATFGANQHAYFAAIDAVGTSVWPTTRHTYGGPDNNVFGYAVAFQEENAYFTGTYRDNMFYSPIIPRNYDGPLEQHHLYVVAYDALLGDFVWDNVTTSMISSSRHQPYGIAADDFGDAFIAGGYSYHMGYFFGTPTSGDLISTAQDETFVMRVNLATSELRSSEVLSDDKTEINSEFTFKLMPNPASELTTVQIANYIEREDYRLKLYGIEGKLILNEPVNSELTEIDLSNLESGVYIVELISHDKYHQLKLIKEK